MRVMSFDGNSEFDLLPCPFCGSDPEIKYGGNEFTKRRRVVIRCPKCRVERQDAALRYDMIWIEGHAVTHWNQRPDGNGESFDLARLRKIEEAAKVVTEGFEKGVFVRSTTGDDDPGWAIKLFPYLKALGVLANNEGSE